MALDVRNAVGAAQKHFGSLRDMIGFGIEDIRLEEAELSEDKQYWLITLSFKIPNKYNENNIANLMGNLPYEREYKVFKIDATTGEVQSMKIRDV